MKRKVIQVADSTILVSLPMKWIKQYGVKKGDEVTLEERGSSILVSTDFSKNHFEGNFDFAKYPVFLVDRMIARIYEMGYDKVTIRYSSPEQLKQIEKRIPELMGFEIVESDKNTIVVQSISSHNPLEFDNIIRKAFLVAKDMFEQIVVNMEKNDMENLLEVRADDLKLNKFSYFCLRQLNKHIVGGNEVYVLFYLSKALEDLGDILKRFITDQHSIGNVDKEILKTFKNIQSLFNHAYDFFYKPQVKTIVDALVLKDKLFEDIRELTLRYEGKESLLLHHLTEMTRKIYHFPTLRLHTLEE